MILRVEPVQIHEINFRKFDIYMGLLKLQLSHENLPKVSESFFLKEIFWNKTSEGIRCKL